MSSDIAPSKNQHSQKKLAQRGLQLPPVIEAAGEEAQKTIATECPVTVCLTSQSVIKGSLIGTTGLFWQSAPHLQGTFEYARKEHFQLLMVTGSKRLHNLFEVVVDLINDAKQTLVLCD